MKTFLTYTLPSVFFVALFFACTPATRITGTWTAPEADKNYNKVLVAAMTSDLQAKKMLEDELAAQLSAQGVDVSKSIDLFSPNFTKDQMEDKEAMLEVIRNNEHNAILTVTLVDKETETRYVPGTTAYAPATAYPYYGNFWGYYSYRYPQVYDPGYYTQEKVYYLETNLYDAQSEALVWSAQSESISPGSLENFAEQLASVTVEEMKEDQLL